MKILVGNSAGFCYGVKRAVDGTNEVIESNTNGSVYGLGEIVHNKQVISNLNKKGIKFIEDINEITDENAKLIIRAHGVNKEIYEIANKKNIEIVDYTCQFVLKIQDIAEKYNKQGYYIFLFGTKEHPEIIGIKSHCKENCSIITEVEDVENAIIEFKKTKINKILVIEQTTYNVNKFNKLLNLLKNKIPNQTEIIIKNTICLATQERQEETNELSKKVDTMIIIGGKNSSNTKKLYEIASENCANTFWIETKDELKKISINAETVGIMAGASTPQESINDVVDFLKLEACM